MPDLLVYTNDANLNHSLEEIGRAAGFRVRSCFELKTVMDWVAVRAFDVAILHASIPLEQQQRIAGALWQQNLDTLFYVFDLASGGKNSSEMRLFGAEVVKGPAALSVLEGVLRGYAAGQQAVAEPFNVLVVEDLQSPRDIICIFIEGMGYVVTGVGSGAEALTLLEADPQAFSCIVTDIRMPKMSGKELIQAVRLHAKLKHLPVIVLTAFGTADCLLDCLAAGASGFLVKPPKKADLQRELGRAKRIFRRGLNPYLISADEVELFRDTLQEKGYF